MQQLMLRITPSSPPSAQHPHTSQPAATSAQQLPGAQVTAIGLCTVLQLALKLSTGGQGSGLPVQLATRLLGTQLSPVLGAACTTVATAINISDPSQSSTLAGCSGTYADAAAEVLLELVTKLWSSWPGQPRSSAPAALLYTSTAAATLGASVLRACAARLQHSIRATAAASGVQQQSAGSAGTHNTTAAAAAAELPAASAVGQAMGTTG
jgi:hypothetical protein